jgi:large subunit ribosomal protein L25
MSDKISLTVTKRTVHGKAVKKLRAQDLIPANIFGKGVASLSVQVNKDLFSKAFDKAGETGIVYLSVEGEKTERPVLITNTHIHPVTDAVLHIDFHQVDLTQTVTATIEVVLVGESLAAKEGAVVVQQLNEIEVEALPADLPEAIEVDLSRLAQIGDTITVADLDVDTTKVKMLTDANNIVAIAQEPQEEEVEEPVAEATAETPAAPEAEKTEA